MGDACLAVNTLGTYVILPIHLCYQSALISTFPKLERSSSCQHHLPSPRPAVPLLPSRVPGSGITLSRVKWALE